MVLRLIPHTTPRSQRTPFINSLHFINTQRHLSSHVARRSPNCRLQVVREHWTLNTTSAATMSGNAVHRRASRSVHSLFHLFCSVRIGSLSSLAAAVAATAAILMQLLSSFLEISYSSLEIDYFIGRNGIRQSDGAPREMIMFVVWYFICRREYAHEVPRKLCFIPFSVSLQTLQYVSVCVCVCVWVVLYRTHTSLWLVSTRIEKRKNIPGISHRSPFCD